MAGWLSSKLKVAENLLQQIDQQAAGSLGKSERKQHDDLDFNTSPKPSSNVSLRDQFKKKTSENNVAFVNSSTDNFTSIGSSKLNADDNNNNSKQKQLGKQVGKPDLNPRPSVLNDSDWTELLSTPKQQNSTKTGRGNGVPRELGVRKVRGTRGTIGANVSRSVGSVSKIGDGNVLRENGGVGGRKRDDVELRNSHDPPMVSAVGYDERSSDGSEPGRNFKSLGVLDAKEGVESMGSDYTANTNQSLDSGKNSAEAGSSFQRKDSSDKEIVVDDTHRRAFLTNGNNNPHGDFKGTSYTGGGNVSDSDSESSSTSDSDSETEREREAKIQRRRQILAAKAAAKAAEAIKEHENLVARLEGEKQSLEKIVEERAKQAAEEASELQLTMMEVMEAADLEKQKHNHTRMEVLARLAKLETANADLARSLATAQWNLELEVNRVVDFRRQVEMKEVSHEELRRRISSTCPCPNKNTPANFMLSKGIKFEKEMMEAEYSSLTEKVAGLQEKATKLDVNIDLAQKEIGNPTEVEVELKQRLRQMTDYLIQKQAQVEALSSDKAMLIFRIEAVTRLLDENKHLISDADVSSNSNDVEVGRGKGSGSKFGPMFVGKIQSGKQHLGSLLRQLDSVFSAGAVFLARNPVAKLWFLVYLVCLHFWVLYILFSHSWSAEDVTSSSVVSLGNLSNNDA